MEKLKELMDAEILEKLKEVMDAEILERSHLFPVTPYDKSYLRSYLWRQFGGAHCCFVTEDLSYYVEHALSISRSRKSEGRSEVKLSFELVTQLLHTQPCYRLNSLKVDAETLLEGKYIMACSLQVPDSWYTCARELAIKSHELYAQHPHGRQIMTVYRGCPSMFPFTKMSIVDRIMKELSQVTLQYLFNPITSFCLEAHSCDNYKCKESLLKGKNALVYFDWNWAKPSTRFNPFISWCKTLEVEKCDFESVFVCLNPHDEIHGTMFKDLRLPIPTWLIHPADELAFSKYVVQNFFMKLFKHKFPTVVAFGEDGKICSMLAHRVVSSSCKAGAFPFDDPDLPGEVYKILDDYYKILFEKDDIE